MGSCFSKKTTCASSSSQVELPKPPEKFKPATQIEKSKVEEVTVNKEIFIIKHRKSHDVLRDEEGKPDVKKVEEAGVNCASGNGVAAVRTSSCTKEELDAILIQCGRLSRSSSTGKAALNVESGKKYSGSKRSYDFDNESSGGIDNAAGDGDDDCNGATGSRHRQRSRQSSGRRRTPSRERERDQQRSASKERNSSGGRRVSRSPGRKSESPITSGATNSSASNVALKAVKMVSVPATVSSSMDKNNNGDECVAAAAAAAAADPGSSQAIRRIQVKRNAGGDGSRTASSPSTRSPARCKTPNDNHNVNPCQILQQTMSLSRSNSRKAEISPYRSNPLAEIDTNIIALTPLLKQNGDNHQTIQVVEEESKRAFGGSEGRHVALNVIASGSGMERHIRSRSSQLSKELDINPETLLNPTPSYTCLLLEDIQNFHQKNTAPPAFTLPPCITKACSILEAVADLNSSTGSNTFSQERRRNPLTEQQQFSSIINNSSKSASAGIANDPLVESEVIVQDDLMDPTFHKYVTVGRGTVGDFEDLEEQESSGSNSFAGSQQNWMSSSGWEPNSVDSSSRSTTRRQNEASPVVGLKKNGGLKKNQQTEIGGRSRTTGLRGPKKSPVAT